MKFSSRKKIKFGLGLSIFILLIASLISWYSIKSLIERSAMVEHTHIVLVKLENIFSIMKDAESAQRGYQITGNIEFLEPFNGAYEQVLINYNQLQILTRDNAVQQKRLKDLKVLIEKKFSINRRMINLQMDGKQKESYELVSSMLGKRTMDRIRFLITQINDEEQRLLKSREKEANTSTLFTPMLVILVSLIAIGIVIFLFYKILSDIESRIKAEKKLALVNKALEESYEELAVREEQLREVNLELEERVENRAKDLLESERRYRFMAESIPAIVWTANPDGGLDYYSKKWMDYTGLSLEETVGWGWRQVTHPDDVQPTVDAWSKAIKSGNEYKIQHRIKGKDGKYRWLFTRAVPLKNEEGKIIKWFGTAVDIEDEKSASEKLRLSEEKYRILSESIPQLIWTTNAEGQMEYVNQNWLAYTGQTMEKALEFGLDEVLHSDDRTKAIEQWKRSIINGNIYKEEYRLKNINGTYRWFLGKGIPVKDESGVIIKWFGTITDIHDQKVSQEILKQKNEELIRINNDLDNFIYTASHDLKAPISNIEGLLYTLNESLEGEHIDKDDLNNIASMMRISTERFKHTIQDLTEITKVQKNIVEDIEKINFRNIFSEVSQTINDQVKALNANITSDLKDIDPLYFSKKNMRSILYNLLSNAIKFHSPERKPEVHIKTEKINNYTLLTIKDNGLGIPAKHTDKLFAMFKRFHDHVEGTGIGLYIVKRILDNSGGKIEVESEVDKGTTFKVYFKNI